jgi:hypothetical protein
MFGLTRREQWWAAEERAAKMLVALAQTALTTRAQVEIAEAQTDAAELVRLRAEVSMLRSLLRRYRTETPLGHQPHMIAHEVDAALGPNADITGR